MIEDLSKITGLSWHTIKSIEKQYLERRYRHIGLKGVKYLAIDEFAIQKGHKYMTVVMDLQSGRILHVGMGKGGDALRDFWRKIRRFKKSIKAVAMDMWPAYISSVSHYLPKAQIVYDWFHIVQMINQGIDKLRRQIYREELTQLQRSVLKGSRWLLLKRGYNLNQTKDEKQRLEEALQLNKPLATMYYMKEELPLMWHQSTKSKAEEFLTDWCARAISSGIKILMKIANTLLAFRTGILAWFDHPISTSPLEGLNNKIKVLKRRAYGYRDLEFFKLKLFDLHNVWYALLR